MQLNPNDLAFILEQARQSSAKDKILRQSMDMVNKYKSSLATGRFDRAAKILEKSRYTHHMPLNEPIAPGVPRTGTWSREIIRPQVSKAGMLESDVVNTMGYNTDLIKRYIRSSAKTNYVRELLKRIKFAEFLNELDRGIGSVNSPLLDLFGPVQSNQAMRSMKSKYLQDEGGI